MCHIMGSVGKGKPNSGVWGQKGREGRKRMLRVEIVCGPPLPQEL